MKAILIAVFLGLSGSALAAGGPAVPLDHIETDITDQPSLQRGLKLYTNYCMGCHALGHQRFERTATDLGIPLELYAEHLIFDDHKIGDLMTIAMPEEKSKNWFGNPPPDLTLVSRLRGADWLYTYLRGFYLDPSRPYGVNNTVFKDVGMPHVLYDLQGVQTMGCGPVTARDAGGQVMRDNLSGESMMQEKCDVLMLEEGSGEMTPAEFDAAIYDLVNFLQYVGEPSRLKAQRIGPFVLLFVLLFTVVAYLLKREYWKDVR